MSNQLSPPVPSTDDRTLPVQPLERITAWADHFQQRLNLQSTFFQVAEQNLLIELRLHYSEDIDPRLAGDLLDAALQHRIEQAPLTFDEALHAPYRPDGRAVWEMPSQRRDVMVQLVESASSRLFAQYQDYLTRYWQSAPQGLADRQGYLSRVGELVDGHCDKIKALLESAEMAQMSVDELRARLGECEDQWHGQLALTTLASGPDRKWVEALLSARLPHWYKLLGEPQRASLKGALLDWQDAEDQLSRVLGDVQSLQRHANRCAQDYLDDQLEAPVFANRVTLKRLRLNAPDNERELLSLVDMVAEGAQAVDQQYQLSDIADASLLSSPPSSLAIKQLMARVDAPATYLQALVDRHNAPEVGHAMFDVYHAALKYSAQRAVYAGHLQASHFESLATLRSDEPDLDVSTVELFDDMACSDLLVFFRRGEDWPCDGLFLYAPGKPDGQEWVELSSLRALSAEVGSWMKDAVGQDYLLTQLPVPIRDRALSRMSRIRDLPGVWDLTRDIRGPLRGYQACVEAGVLARMKRRQVEVAQSESPPWYSALAIEARRAINLTRNEARSAENAFLNALKSYESFQDFSRRSIRDAIKPYLSSKGVLDPVEPESIIFDVGTGLADGTTRAINLVDIVCYGYDDNAGIDHPEKGVRSLMGQDLSALRSAELAQYARRAYVGEKYIEHVRKEFLQASASSYVSYQRLFANALITGMDRDLRVAHGRGQIDADTFNALTRLVTTLGATMGQEKRHDTSELVADHDGIFRLTINSHSILGAYVFRYLEEGRAHDWLYAPGAANGVLFSRYSALGLAGEGPSHDYLLQRAPIIGRRSVEQRLQALSTKSAHRDALRRFNQVLTIAGEYDAYIEHGLKDVDDVTNSRADVIRAQIFKGLLYATVPLSLVCPPFAVILGGYFALAPLRSAIIAHVKGDTSQALQHWLHASWGLLGLMVMLPGFSLKAMGALMNEARRVVTLKRAPLEGPLRAPSMRFDKRWAIQNRPDALQKVTEPGIWQGTYRNGMSSEARGVEHFVLSRGRYFKVVRDVERDTLRVVKANRVDSLHREAIARTADGRWVANSTGLRGGNPVEDVGRISSLRSVGRGEHPNEVRGAFQGEAVVGRFVAEVSDNYLFTLNAQTCVAVSLYCPVTRAGAVIHFDHNIRVLIERAVREVLSRIRGAASNEVRAVMAGGDWLGGANIGEPIRSVLRRQGISAQWDHWSYSSCFGNTYGMTLDLSTGATRVYTTSVDLVQSLYDPILRGARAGRAGMPGRAHQFMQRVRAEPLFQGRSGAVLNSAGRVFSPSEYEHNAIVINLMT